MSSDSSVSSKNILDNLPKVISKRFVVRELIGRGGVGVVLRCKDTVLNNTVAVKFLLNDVSKEMAARFQREAITAARLNHRNIVRVSDFGQNDDGRLFLVMEYLEGGTLLDEIKMRGSYDISEVLPIIIKICDGLNHAHNLGVLHRDVKPSNVMLSEEPNNKIVPKLVDFGLARLEKDDQQVTIGGRLMGSPSYLSPEAAKGLEPDNRSDIYSLGCLIFECLAGVPPFLEQSAFETLNSKLNQPPPSLVSKAKKTFPPQVEAIVAKCLCLDPNERYSSINLLKQALEELYELEEVEDESEESDEFSLGETLVLSPSSQSDDVPRKLNYRNIAIFVALLVALIVTVFFVFKSITFDRKPNSNRHNSASTSRKQVRGPTKPKFEPVRYNDQNWLASKGGSIHLALQELKKKKNITAFQFADQPVTGAGLILLPQANLRSLSLKSCSIDNKAMRVLGQMDRLTYLDLSKVKGVTDKGVTYLVGLRSLKRLGLNRTEVSDKIFEVLPSLKNLETLELLNCNNLKGSNIEKLVFIPRLMDLKIGGRNIEIDELARFRFLRKMPNLRYLKISHLLINDSDLTYIKKLPLRGLELSSAMITDKGIQELSSMFSLKRLRLDNCIHVTIDGVRGLRKSMPNCKIYYD